MQPRTKGLVAALTGTALGVGGLVMLTVPAGADDAPVLPEISAQELVRTALQADPPAFAGKVVMQQNLGLPVPTGGDGSGAASFGLGFESARIFHDGDEGVRIAIQDLSAEFTLVRNADELWTYDSAENTATRLDTDDVEAAREQAGKPGPRRVPSRQPAEMADPAKVAQAIVDRLSETSTITVDGTAMVADRPAYELVLTPKPTERTVLREVKVAVDAETRLPLRFEVMGNGSTEPIFSLGFTEFTVGAQPERLFEFTPPKDAKIVDAQKALKERADMAPSPQEQEAMQRFGSALDVVGDGWDTVLTGKVPQDVPAERAHPDGESDRWDGDAESPQDLLDGYGKRITGAFGAGYVITSNAGSALITDDGRFAVGAVPVQVLEQALAK